MSGKRAKWPRRILAWAAAAAVLVPLCASSARADDGVPYDTYFINSKGQRIFTQTAYIPSMIIDGYGSTAPGEGEPATLNTPEDIFIDSSDLIYIADTGNGRIAVFSHDGKFIRSVGRGVLKRPTGVCVGADGSIYVADNGNSKVYRFSPEGELLLEAGRPDSPLFGKGRFDPTKIAVDQAGTMYVVSAGAVNGLVQLNAQGGFLGFFGGNMSQGSLLRSIQRLLFTDEQLSRLSSVIPPTASNVAVDRDGLVYTSTQTTADNAIKRFNVAGANLLKNVRGASATISDITVDGMGNIYAVDFQLGRVIEYNKDGALVFVFGGVDVGRQQMGRFRSPSGVAVDSAGRLYILDKDRNNVQVLVATDFARLVHSATALYLDGKYIESKTLWQEVLKRNSMFELAHLGIGMAEYKQQNFQAALEEFRLANNKQGYSDSFWEIRRVWIMRNLPATIIALAALALAWAVLKRLDRKLGFTAPARRALARVAEVRFIADFLHPLRFLRHPIDACYEIKREGKGSVAAATAWLLIYTALVIASVYHTGFIFNASDPRTVKLGQVLLVLWLPLALWVVCNYLVSAVNSGEGRMRDIYVGTVSAMMPVILFSLPLILISNCLTLLEAVVYDFLNWFAILWSAVLLFIMVKEVHDYEIGGTLKNILLTVFLAACMCALAVVLFGLTNQFLDFISSVYQEVRIRG